MKQATILGARILVLTALILASRTVHAGDDAERRASITPRLLVVWHDPHGLYPGTASGVAREVRSLFASVNLDIEWQRAQQFDPPLDERTILIRIVLMPSDPAGPGWELGEDVMGAVLPGNGRARSVYVFYPTLVRGMKLRFREGGLLDFKERELLERALGRVVAHEMVHAIAPRVHHARNGLMRSGVTRSFLASQDVIMPRSLKEAFLAGAERILLTSDKSASGTPPRMGSGFQHSSGPNAN